VLHEDLEEEEEEEEEEKKKARLQARPWVCGVGVTRYCG